MRNVPKDCMSWFQKEKSLYDTTDYRSRFYQGHWEKAWLQEVIIQAIENKKNIYETMWAKYEDKMEHMPKSLYKFFPFNINSIKCIEENAVFVNSPENFNDPFDCLIYTDEKEFAKEYMLNYFQETNAIKRGVLTEEEYKKLYQSSCIPFERLKYASVYRQFDSVVFHLQWDDVKHEEKKHANEVFHVYEEAINIYRIGVHKLRNDTIKVSSFSNLKKEQLVSFMEMWAHYAQNHMGFCVEYNIEAGMNDKRELSLLSGALLPCTYGAKPIHLGQKNVYKYVMNERFTEYQKMQFEKSIILSFLKKSSSWSYEKEWRIILPKDICDIYKNMIPFFPIKAIYLGCKMPQDDREYMYRLAQRKNIAVYVMGLQEQFFELDAIPIDLKQYGEEKRYHRQRELNASSYESL